MKDRIELELNQYYMNLHDVDNNIALIVEHCYDIINIFNKYKTDLYEEETKDIEKQLFILLNRVQNAVSEE